MNQATPLPGFSAVGIELELMIVDAETLDVRPIADELIRAECGAYETEIERGDIAWSNELVAHLVELKTNGPRPDFRGLAESFQREVDHMLKRLEPLGARLLPTGMHPWMDPTTETVLWPHEYADVYTRFDRIFDCRSHGWANVQSVHVNLPFAGDAEFGRLHAAVRALLPILPALAASSPIVGGRPTNLLDNRLDFYRKHAGRVPEIGGAIVPEPLYNRRDYEGLLARIYTAIAPHDPDGVLRHEWLNARGAIARFDRSAIEIRLLDVQETPRADVAVAAAVFEAARGLFDGTFADQDALRRFPTDRLKTVLSAVAHDAEETVIRDGGYLDLFAYPHERPCDARSLWEWILENTLARRPDADCFAEPLERILEQGTLARRILTVLGHDRRRERLREVYGELADCLASGRLFDVGAD